ncbi:MAG: aminotransferase class III-fold pyridoxal phosphate-dependent enzyme, partial [Bacteroidetes bacterium]|nr:aminotransferase class III-fold pyridoxal phosphate-dependent enzyme [Bacteroidota bacterium]
DTPSAENIEELTKIINTHGNEIACFIYEPLLQAAGGMLMYEAKYLDKLLDELKKKNIICIADEVMTGFYRTGKFFASGYLQNKPDIICLSKGLTGGTMALGVTAASQKIFDAFISDDKSKTFFHGHSFTANPIACAASLASLDLTEKEDCFNQVKNIENQNNNFAAHLTSHISHLTIKNVRSLGTILAFEIISGNDSYLNSISASITKQALQKGIYIRPLGNTVYIMPPYCITDNQLSTVYSFLLDIIMTNEK